MDPKFGPQELRWNFFASYLQPLFRIRSPGPFLLNESGCLPPAMWSRNTPRTISFLSISHTKKGLLMKRVWEWRSHFWESPEFQWNSLYMSYYSMHYSYTHIYIHIICTHMCPVSAAEEIHLKDYCYYPWRAECTKEIQKKKESPQKAGRWCIKRTWVTNLEQVPADAPKTSTTHSRDIASL